MRNPCGEAVAVRVRARNCNGWGEWSDRGVAQRCGAESEAKSDALRAWMFAHAVEDLLAAARRFGVRTAEELLQLTSSDVGSGRAARR